MGRVGGPTVQPTQWHLPTGSHCSEQCELRGSHCSAPMVALLGAVRSPGLRSAKGRASHCENPGVAVRKSWPRTAKIRGRTARPPGRTARSSAKSSVALRRVDASQCEKFCSHCEILASHCQNFRSASQIFRSAKRFASQCEPTGFALRRVWGRTAKGPGSQCEEKIFAVRTDKPRSAKSLGSQCEEPGVAVRGPRVALREGRDRTAKSSAKKKVRSAGSVGRCHCVGWSTGPS